jgi:hypothetical protein
MPPASAWAARHAVIKSGGVGDHCGAADRDIERRYDHHATIAHNQVHTFGDVVDEPVRFIVLSCCDHKFALAGRQSETSLADPVIAPQQLMTETVAVEEQTRVEVGNPYRHGVYAPEHRYSQDSP